MHFFLPKIIAAIVALTVWTNTLASRSFSLVDDVAHPTMQVSSNSDSIPPGWHKIDAEGKFTFYLPSNMYLSGTGIDDFHREYTNGKIHLSFDYEPSGYLAYENRELAYGKGFQETELQIDGRRSYLFLYQAFDYRKRRIYCADVFVGDLPNHKVILHMWIICWSQRRMETVKTIFGTIKFSERGTRS